MKLRDMRHSLACRVLIKWRLRQPGQEDRIDWLSQIPGSPARVGHLVSLSYSRPLCLDDRNLKRAITSKGYRWLMQDLSVALRCQEALAYEPLVKEIRPSSLFGNIRG